MREHGATRPPLLGRLWKLFPMCVYAVALMSMPNWLSSLGPSPALAGPPDIPADRAGQYQAVTFRELSSFAYDDQPLPIDSEGRAKRDPVVPYPSEVRALDGKRVALKGFLMPITFEKDRVTEFMLMSRPDMGCCFGVGMNMNEWVLVKWGGPTPGHMDFTVPFTVFGTLAVGADVQAGLVVSLYRMQADDLRPSS